MKGAAAMADASKSDELSKQARRPDLRLQMPTSPSFSASKVSPNSIPKVGIVELLVHTSRNSVKKQDNLVTRMQYCRWL